MGYFPTYGYSKNKIETELDLSNHAKKSDLKNATGVDKSLVDTNEDLPNLKSEVDNLDVDKLAQLDADKLKSVPVDFKKLSDVVNKKVVKKDIYNPKIKDIEDKIPGITNLATTAALTYLKIKYLMLVI